MNAKDSPTGLDQKPPLQTDPQNPLFAPVAAGLLSWAAISCGFFGLNMLMQQRPEFVGQPMRVTKAALIQESPQIVVRAMTDDVSVVKPVQPESSDVRFDMQGRRDYRGLRTVMDMSGRFQASYVLTNAADEPGFVLFKCPHPRTQDGDLQAGELKLRATTGGAQDNGKDAWFWSGTLGAHSSTTVEISYQVASLKSASYRVGGQGGNQVKQLRVAFHRQDLDSMRFESGDGTKSPTGSAVVWERRDFLAPDFFSGEIIESRSLFVSLSQLLQIGPLICLLFLLAVSAVILTRQKLTAVQMLTIAAGYALYFPLILYLSSRFLFAVALVIAVVVPGVLLVNYTRWLLGVRLGLLGAPVFLVLYQVFPTLAAFAGWNRGMVLLCLGVVTLAVLINLQNQAFKRKAVAGAAALMLLAVPSGVNGAEVQLTLPAELVARLQGTDTRTTNSLVAFAPAEYQVQQEAGYFNVEARIPFQVQRAGETIIPLFDAPIYLQEYSLESPEPDLSRIVTTTNRLGLYVQRLGKGALRFAYRVPAVNREGKRRAQIPLALTPSANVRLQSPRNDLEILNGGLWGKSTVDKLTTYDIGTADEETLVIEWRDQGGDSASAAALTEGLKEFYGIGITRAQNLTVINSDGSCTHFAEFELPVFQGEEFRLKLPPQGRLISVSVNGVEINSPTVEDQLCRIRLPAREAQQTSHRLSLRIAYPAVRLGFVGTVELALPEVFQTTGTLEWVVALPNGFEAQVVSSGMDTQKTPPDLSRFGDYGRILKSQTHSYLAKNLAPPGIVNLGLKYRQIVPGIYEARAE